MADSTLDDRLRAADWLAAHQGLEPAARLIRPEDSRTNYLASLLELDIASRRQEWGIVKQALANTNRVISPTVRSCLEAGVAMSEGGAQKADALYRTAMDAAAVAVTADSDLQYIAIMAERTTNLLAAVSAHEFRLQRGANVGDASANILRLTANGLPLVRQFPALEARHNLMPEDVATSSQYFYTAAILGRNLEDAKRGLMALREAYPDRPEPILGLALIALRTGALVEATNMLEEHPLDFEALPARLRAALVHVLGRIGQKDLARTYARKLDLNAYYPEERELVEPWLNR